MLFIANLYLCAKFYNIVMKILMLNGSPRRDGNIAQMLDVMREEAEAEGHEVVVMRVSEMLIQPCTGCMSCRSKRRCMLPDDDAQRVSDILMNTDVLVIGAPCYWGNLPGQIKVLFDRMVAAVMDDRVGLFPKPLHKGKRAIIIATSTVPFPFNMLMNQTQGVIKAVKKILRYSGFKVVATMEKGGTKTRPELTEKEIKKCRSIIKRLE